MNAFPRGKPVKFSFSPASAPPRLTSFIVLLMSVAVGLSVASNYYAQPLLHSIGSQFNLSTAAAGSVVTVAQLSYAAGLILLVPLGDIIERRSLIVLMTALSAFGLLITAFAPSLSFVILGTVVAGGLSVVAQILIPFASTLAAPGERGKVVGTVMSGLLLGILLARTVAGTLADLGSWRTVYWVAAVLMLAMSGALWLVLPRYKSPVALSYQRLLASIIRLYTDEPLFRARALLGGLLFASFGMLWTSLTFLLVSPPYSYSNTIIGLFGLAGAAGAYAANWFGRMTDRGQGNRFTCIGLILLLVSWLPVAFGQISVLSLLVGILLQDLAIQGVHVTNLNAIYRLDPEARSRLTAGMMTSNFIGAAAGSLISSWIFSYAGWSGVCIVGALLATIALVYAICAQNACIPENV
ncbi:arabinose efflux permease family protein [Photorhabdus temperata subsp. temperata Meg1]|uniref:Arabinose efflux permease family protein n=2 Tax=Photorhabdus temperata TaxID=574560 RepID=A0A081RRT9_PHOTE|nr:arabinose efflux permease family protein [Photorhabdus temperata subsp. temperata Meg1]